MKAWRTIFLVMSALLTITACSPDPTTRSDDDRVAKLISLDETRRVGMHVLLNRHPNAEIVSERDDGNICTYRFSTNGVTAPFLLIVDRKTSKARFGKVSD